MNWEIGIDMYILMCIKWMNKKNLLYKKKKNQNSQDNFEEEEEDVVEIRCGDLFMQ